MIFGPFSEKCTQRGFYFFPANFINITRSGSLFVFENFSAFKSPLHKPQGKKNSILKMLSIKGAQRY